jgi:site-specific recombinase XerD
MELIPSDDKIVEEIIEKYLLSIPEPSRKEYKKNVLKFFAWFTKSLRRNLDTQTLEDYKNNLIFLKYATTTINAYLSPLRSFFVYCVKKKHLEDNPAEYIKGIKVKPSEVKQARNLSDEELKALFDHTDKTSLRAFSERILLLLSFNLGLRVSEVTGIKRRDIVLNSDEPTIRILGKGDKERTLGLNDVLVKELFQFISLWGGKLSFDDYLIQPSYFTRNRMSPKPASTSYVSGVFQRYCEKADINPIGVSTHSGRVTAINILLDLEIQIRDVANFAGHASVDTTKRYDRKEQKQIIKTSKAFSVG